MSPFRQIPSATAWLITYLQFIVRLCTPFAVHYSPLHTAHFPVFAARYSPPSAIPQLFTIFRFLNFFDFLDIFRSTFCYLRFTISKYVHITMERNAEITDFPYFLRIVVVVVRCIWVITMTTSKIGERVQGRSDLKAFQVFPFHSFRKSIVGKAIDKKPNVRKRKEISTKVVAAASCKLQ